MVHYFPGFHIVCSHKVLFNNRLCDRAIPHIYSQCFSWQGFIFRFIYEMRCHVFAPPNIFTLFY